MPNQPLSVIAELAFLANVDARDQLVVAGLDASDAIAELASWPLDGERPCDEAALTITRWPSSIRAIAAVAYSDTTVLNLRLLEQAATAAQRRTVQLLHAGSGRWRSEICSRPRCCPRTGNRYHHATIGHPAFEPFPQRRTDPQGWRTDHWDRWQVAIRDGAPAERSSRAALALSLQDIPLRDALLAQSAREHGAARPAFRALLQELQTRCTLGTALPLYTCLAAMLYLDGDVDASRALVNAVLMVDEYSLARLLRNGLDMHAPSSLLARSFAHFDPIDLLAA